MKGLCLINVLFVALVLGAEPNDVPATPSPAACAGPEFRQFDFWLGLWKVSSPEGKELGKSEISRASGNCSIREQWTSNSGITGMSLNYYDNIERKWHQDWVGSDGSILHLRGARDGSRMILEGNSKDDKEVVLNRITWTPLAGGSVKQEWIVSSDNGKTWKTSFVGIYQKQ